MNEEEKQAIDWLKNELDDEKKSCKNCNYSYKGVTGLYGNNEVEIALKLIEKQQKEIEKLKSRKYILNAETNEIKEIPISDDYISKAKIKEIISKYVDIEEHLVYHHQELWGADLAQMIKELLGE